VYFEGFAVVSFNKSGLLSCLHMEQKVPGSYYSYSVHTRVAGHAAS
jgi:hypothetical protein